MDITLAMVVFVVLLGATGAMRLGEVVVSAIRMRRRPDAVVSEPALFPAMAALHAALIALPILEVILLSRPFVAWVGVPALVVLCLATGLRIWTLRTLGRAWNVRVVRPDTTAVVAGGPYRWIRHPNYLVVILEIAALPLVHTAWISAIVLSVANGAVLTVRIRNEERMLSQIPAWREAMAKRSRLIPGLF